MLGEVILKKGMIGEYGGEWDFDGKVYKGKYRIFVDGYAYVVKKNEFAFLVDGVVPGQGRGILNLRGLNQ